MHDFNKYVQNAYDRILEDGLPGSKADANPRFVDSFVCEEVDGIGYGLVVSQGSIGPHNGRTQTALLGGATIAATAGTMSGTGSVADLADLVAIADAEFDITVDGTLIQVRGLDMSGAASYAAIATLITTELGVAAVCTYDDGHFIVTSATTGVASTVSLGGAAAVPATGVNVHELLGIDSGEIVDGEAALTPAVLGVTLRVLISESRSVSESNEVVTKEGEIGAVVADGRIKVLANEAALDKGDVYFNDTTGEIFASAAAGRTQLGSAKYVGAAVAGKVALIDVSGLR